MKRADKIKLLKAISNGEISLELAFNDPGNVFIEIDEPKALIGGNGKVYTPEKIDLLGKEKIFILPDNKRG